MTIVSIVIGLMLSFIDPITGDAINTTPEAAAAQAQSSDYVICEEIHP